MSQVSDDKGRIYAPLWKRGSVGGGGSRWWMSKDIAAVTDQDWAESPEEALMRKEAAAGFEPVFRTL